MAHASRMASENKLPEITTIEPGDTITLFLSPQGEAQWQAFLKGSTEEDHPSSSLVRETVEETKISEKWKTILG